MKLMCSATGCVHNDGGGKCECRSLYISDMENGEPRCMDARFLERVPGWRGQAFLPRTIGKGRGNGKG